MAVPSFNLRRFKYPRHVAFFVVFGAAGMLFGQLLPVAEAVVSGFDLAAFTFIGTVIPLWHNGSPETIRRQAARDDGGRVLLLLVSATIVVVIIVALARLIFERNSLDTWHIVLLVGTMASSWFFANLVFAMHYAHLFYDGAEDGGQDRGGLDFPGDGKPSFSDFVNFSFVIGMTCQTADIQITAAKVRKVSTFHGLFAFVFNLGILALTVNVIAGGI